MRVERDAPLAPLTWYRVGGPARMLVHPANHDELSAVARRCHEGHIPMYVLGLGANLLVADGGVDGVVLQLDEPAFCQWRYEENRLVAGAGCDLMKLVLETAHAGRSGLETLAGIPATVGGATRMNAGGAFGAIGPAVARVRVMDDQGEVYERQREDLVFGYRYTNITARFILEVEFDLAEDDPDELTRTVKEIFLYKKNSQPMGDRSPGCAFKNPVDDEATPGRADSAGSLIDRAGLKGYREGGASVSQRHANFIVADEGATCANVLAVLEHVEETVLEQFGVRLQREVIVWP